MDGCVWWLRLMSVLPIPKVLWIRGLIFKQKRKKYPSAHFLSCTIFFISPILVFYLKVIFMWRPFWCFLLTVFFVLSYMFIRYCVVFKWDKEKVVWSNIQGGCQTLKILKSMNNIKFQFNLIQEKTLKTLKYINICILVNATLQPS